MKLYGGYSKKKKKAMQTQTTVGGKQKKEKRRKTALDRVVGILMTLVILEALYCTAVFSDIAFIQKYRNLWIQTAMSTGSHHWLATAFIPGNVVDEVMWEVAYAKQAQIGVSTSWGDGTTAEPEEGETIKDGPAEQFYDLYWEIDPDTMEAYVEKNPDVLNKGWDQIYINEAGLEDNGTSIRTTAGDQVLAIDVPNQTLVLRVSGSGYQGVLVIAKDPSKLSVRPAKNLGSYGENAGVIGERHNGLVAMTASGFIDPDGNGNGGTMAGYAMMNGEEHGEHFVWGYKRLEIHNDDRFYITDANGTTVDPDTRDAVEFTPALIIDGENLVDENADWNGLNPRACIGQNDRGEILMLAIEGRQTHSLGTGVAECARILERYNCMQAMNLDGGTSAILWYDGEYIMRCSNQAIPEGRLLPNAFVYERTTK